MNSNLKALDVKRPGYEEEDDDQEEMLPPEIEGGMKRKVEMVMPLEQYQQMQMGSPSEVPQEMLDPELIRRMGM